jgi:hypothetical protein
MAENQAAGPQMCQSVIYTETATNTYPAIVIAVAAASGLVRLTTFAPGGATADQQNVSFDPTGTVSGTWRYPDGLTGI